MSEFTDVKVFTNEEMIIGEVIVSARKIQEFLWKNMNNEAGLEEYKRMLRKRLSKIENINTDNPHWEIELKKRLLQIAAISVQVINKLNTKDLKDGVHPSLPSNLPQYNTKVKITISDPTLTCIDKECVDYPHQILKNMHHVPCAMCGLPRPYIETEDWQTQKEMSKMCSGCLDEAYGDNSG